MRFLSVHRPLVVYRCILLRNSYIWQLEVALIFVHRVILDRLVIINRAMHTLSTSVITVDIVNCDSLLDYFKVINYVKLMRAAVVFLIVFLQFGTLG
jgi:hypothetical protein